VRKCPLPQFRALFLRKEAVENCERSERQSRGGHRR
jgi:hypothetical protein